MATALLGRGLSTSMYRSVAAIRHSSARKSPGSYLSIFAKRPASSSSRNKWTQLYRTKTLYLGTATLAVVAPLGLPSNEKRNEEDGPEKTTEQLMLEESDLEREELWMVSKDQPLTFRVLRNIQVFVVNWVIEPLATGFRFITLVTIFVPVILAVPLCCLGPRIPERSNERKGIIMWYAFLIKSMENAGPTFVKVEFPSCHTHFQGCRS